MNQRRNSNGPKFGHFDEYNINKMLAKGSNSNITKYFDLNEPNRSAYQAEFAGR